MDLARAASLGVNTVRRAELAERETSMTAANELALRRALESGGVELSTKTVAVPVYVSESDNRTRGDSQRHA
jgi:hypothetical protein